MSRSAKVTMDHPLLPWWVILLLGMWSVALTVWQHPSTAREPRLWSGVLALIYVLLIFLALGVGVSSQLQAPPVLAALSLANFGLGTCFISTLISAVWMLGPLSVTARRLCYLVFTVSNAVICALLGCLEVTLILVLVAVINSVSLIREKPTISAIKRGVADLVQFHIEPIRPEKSGELWLLGMVSVLMACLLLGTLGYAFRHEMSDNPIQPQRSVLPTQTELTPIAVNSGESTENTSLWQVATGQRPDIVILLAMIVFLALAVSQQNHPREPSPMISPDSAHSDGGLVP